MSRGCRRRVSCTRWSAITSRASARRPPVYATAKACPVRRAGRLRAKRYGVPCRSLGGGGSFARCGAAAAWPFDQAQGHPERSRGMAGGFARFRCDDCGLDRLVPFSCKGMAACASCARRRMAERAAHLHPTAQQPRGGDPGLVDHVFPPVPVRQCRGSQRGSRAGVEWVLTFPHRLRYRLAWDHDLCCAVMGVSVRTVIGFLRHVSRQAGVPDGRGGAVATFSVSAGRSLRQVYGPAGDQLIDANGHATTWACRAEAHTELCAEAGTGSARTGDAGLPRRSA